MSSHFYAVCRTPSPKTQRNSSKSCAEVVFHCSIFDSSTNPPAATNKKIAIFRRCYAQRAQTELLPRFHVSSQHSIPQRFGTHHQPEIAPPSLLCVSSQSRTHGCFNAWLSKTTENAGYASYDREHDGDEKKRELISTTLVDTRKQMRRSLKFNII